jgi:hypothetical protein
MAAPSSTTPLAVPTANIPPDSYGAFFRGHEVDAQQGYILTEWDTRPLNLPVNWSPIGYPCMVDQDWSGDNQLVIENVPAIPVFKGMRGVVSRVEAKKTHVLIDLISEDVINGASRGWVPASFVKIGTERKYGDVIQTKHCTNLLRKIGGINPVADTTTPGKTARLLSNFFIRLNALEYALRFIKSSVFTQIRSYPTSVVLANTITGWIRNTSPDLLKLLDGEERFDYRQLRHACRDPIASDNGKVVIYARFYSDFEGNPHKPAGVYVGSTKNIDNRTWNHDNEMKTVQKNFHYKYAHGARNAVTKVLCVLEDPVMRPLMENVFMLMFESYALFVANADVSRLDSDTITMEEMHSALDQDEYGSALPALNSTAIVTAEAGSSSTGLKVDLTADEKARVISHTVDMKMEGRLLLEV